MIVLYESRDRIVRNAPDVEPEHERRSNRFPGHEARMADHARRIAADDPGDEGRNDRPDMPDEWGVPDEVAVAFRAHAFTAVYNSLAHIHDPARRFVEAIALSAQPVDSEIVQRWHRECYRKTRLRLANGGAE